jgi:hypothetical protein
MPPIKSPISRIFFETKFQKQPAVFAYLKVYPELAKFIEYNEPYHQLGFADASLKSKQHDRTARKAKDVDEAQLLQLNSLRRSKTAISDIILSNTFDMWCTFTFNGKTDNIKKDLGIVTSTDRYDIDLCKKKMSKWLKNQREIHGSFDYLIVPEFHKDGALHFHAFVNEYKGKIKNTGTRKHGKEVYRIASYKLGISEMQYIGQTDIDYRKISSYIKKYITKDMPLFSGKKRYWCSTRLSRPEIIKNPSQERLEQYMFGIKKQLQHLTISHGQYKIHMPTN